MDAAQINRRIQELERIAATAGTTYAGVGQVFHGTISLAAMIYGESSPQVEELQKQSPGGGRGLDLAFHCAVGVLQTIKAELAGGLLGNIRLRLSGEILADFAALSREALDRGDEGSKNVAAVLAAAYFEDTMRRLGAERASVHDRRDLDKVLLALKAAGVLAGPQFSLAQSLLPFRNAAMHAHWARVDRETVSAALAFTQEILLKHFA